MIKLLKNARIIDFENDEIKNVHILINNNVIEKIYEDKNFNIENLNLDNQNIIECNNNLVLTGFINSNSYLIKNFFDKFVTEKDSVTYEEN